MRISQLFILFAVVYISSTVILTSCNSNLLSNRSSKVALHEPSVVASPTQSVVASTTTFARKTEITVTRPMLDILIIADDSSSMDKENAELATRMGGFMAALDVSSIDWQMCITTTDLHYFNGKSVVWSGTSTKILTPSTPNRAQIFGQTISDLTWRASTEDDPRSDEQGIYSLNMSIRQTGSESCHRPSADLGVILISDEDERSVGGIYDLSSLQFQPMEALNQPTSVIPSLSGLFPNKKLIFNAIVVKDHDCEVIQDAQGTPSFSGLSYMRLAQETGGEVGSICDTNYTTALTKFLTAIKRKMTTTRLICSPVDGVNVTYSPSTTPVHEIQGNQVVFSAFPPNGTKVTFEYRCPGGS